MKVILAPHPDDEWIGCGCTLLHALDHGEKVKVLLATRVPRTENRVSLSEQLAKRYGYAIALLGEPERSIDEARLQAFLKKEIPSDAIVYVPDEDTHPDHNVLHRAAQELPNTKIQYCVYNNTTRLLRRLWHKIKQISTGKGHPSFRTGQPGQVFTYKLAQKNKNIRAFGETPRAGDRLR